MRLLPFILFLFLSALLSGQQAVTIRLADEVCACMQQITTQRPRGYARACLNRVMVEHPRLVETILERPVGEDYRKDFTDLLGHITRYLAADCPFLLTLIPGDKAPEYRWSDSKRLNPSSLQFSFPKTADSTSGKSAMAESPEYLWTTGTVVSVDKQSITLTTEEGVKTLLEIPPRMRGRVSFQIGDKRRISYREVWRIKDKVVVKVLEEE